MTIAEQPVSDVVVEALPELLMRVVSELHDVAYLIERVEPQLLEMGGNVLSSESVKILQGIDLAVQKTRGLAEFIDIITGSMPDDWQVDVTTAINLVKLAEMRKALARGIRHGHSQPLDRAAGDFDFF